MVDGERTSPARRVQHRMLASSLLVVLAAFGVTSSGGDAMACDTCGVRKAWRESSGKSGGLEDTVRVRSRVASVEQGPA